MKKQISITLACTLLAVMSLLYSCKTDDPLPTNELMSTTYVIAANQTDLMIDTFQYINFGFGQGLPALYIDTIRLKANTTYAISVKLVQEATNPSVDMTDSITALGDNHLMVYNVDPGADMLKVKILDKDAKGLPIGLMSTWQAQDTTSGYLRLMLYHQPGMKNGTVTPGNLDFEADYPVVVN